MNPNSRKTIPRRNCYVVFNGLFGVLWAIGVPILFCVYFDGSLWIKIPAVAVWIVLSGRVVDRYIPRITKTLASLTALLITAVLGGCASSESPHEQTSSGPPAFIVRQLPDYPMPGRDSDFPGGLVVALWRDGHIIRSAGPKTVGKSYIEGTVPTEQCDEFFAFLRTTVVKRASRVSSVPIHVGLQSITIRVDGNTSRWTRALPDTKSVWRETESRLFGLPLRKRHHADFDFVENVTRNN